MEGEIISAATATGFDDKIPTNIKYPWSVNFSLEYHFDKFKMAFASEYFSRIDPYRAVQSNQLSVIRPSYLDYDIEQSQFLSALVEGKPVFNWAVGLTYNLTQQLELVLGYNTDKSYVGTDIASTFDNNQIFDNPIFMTRNVLNYNHYSLGLRMKRSKGQFSLGFNFVRGKEDFGFAVTNFNDIEVDNFLQGNVNIPTSFSYTRAAIIFGYDYFIGKVKKTDSF